MVIRVAQPTAESRDNESLRTSSTFSLEDMKGN